MHWPAACPVCGKVFDSQDSYGDSKAMVRNHQAAKGHFTEEEPNG